ncbi:alpha/beta fold hydrolase [Xylanibacillus composti]|uniref:Alpha/beta hydrolase n=1 Tax=Xylanibacillus composti TaxID=1572762 RepID=A0A8J4H1X9_9BACL|nr:alpha/beta fold hydrolase [Xylanibacillus composti]MDT9724327.1 alpha/beta fold hydrolase [Xylanibacillus composti]GIQ67917.1 alpha/beta hydrolase [Xylanibacillus composti]
MAQAFQLVWEKNRVIRGDLFPSRRQAEGTIVICHGYKGFKDWGMFPYAAERLAENFDVVSFNFSHNGIGEDLVNFTELDLFASDTYTKDLEDLAEVTARIRSGTLPINGRGPDTELPLYLLGHSRGGAVSLIFALDRPDEVDGVIGWNSTVHVDLLTEEQKAAMREGKRAYVTNARTGQQLPLDPVILEDLEANRERFAIVERITTAQVPIALIQGTEDHKRLQEGNARLVERNPSIRWIRIAGGNHTFNTVHPFQGSTEALEAAIAETAGVLHQWSTTQESVTDTYGL